MQIVIDISKDRYDEIMSMDWKNCRLLFDEELRAIHDGKALEQEPCEDVVSRQAVIDIMEREQFKGDALYGIEKLPSVTPQPCDDAVSRQAVLDLPRIKTHNVWGNVIYESVDVENVRQLPPVTAQPKMGHWVKVIEENGHAFYLCSVCKEGTDENYDWCPFCGCKMQEVEG